MRRASRRKLRCERAVADSKVEVERRLGGRYGDGSGLAGRRARREGDEVLLEGLVGTVGVRECRNDLVAFATSPRLNGDFVAGLGSSRIRRIVSPVVVAAIDGSSRARRPAIPARMPSGYRGAAQARPRRELMGWLGARRRSCRPDEGCVDLGRVARSTCQWTHRMASGEGTGTRQRHNDQNRR